MGDIADYQLESWFEDSEEYDHWREDIMDAAGLIGHVTERLTAKNVKTFSFTFDDREDKRWFGTYDKAPPAAGSYVSFEYTTNGAGFNNVDNKTLKVVPQEQPVPDEQGGETAPPPTVYGNAQTAYKGASNRDANINWQSARNAAVHLMEVANAAGALDLGTGKKDSKLSALIIQTNRLSVEFFNYSMEVNSTGDLPEDFQS